jgi:hypothetical protein
VTRTEYATDSRGAALWHGGYMGTALFSAPVHTPAPAIMDRPAAIGAGFLFSVFERMAAGALHCRLDWDKVPQQKHLGRLRS